MQARWSCPPETSFISLSATSMIPSFRISASPRICFSLLLSFVFLLSAAGSMMLSSIVRFFIIYICWKINPISSRRSLASSFSLSSVISFPSKRTCPLVTRSIPDIAYKSVDLPDPDGPIMAIISPSFTSKFTFLSTLFCLLSMT